MTDRFAHDDAAYVLGALSPQEHAAFEAHLATCAECQARVAEISGVPALLAGITEADLADASLSNVPDTLLPSLLREVRRRRRRRFTIVTAVSGVAAAAIVALSVALASPGSTAPAHPMVALRATPVSATATMTDVSWGTRITLNCHYNQAYGSDQVVYTLVVVGKDGAHHTSGSWRVAPGKTTQYPGGTALHMNQISYIQIEAGTQPILQLNV